MIVTFWYTIAWDGQYCYLGVKYTLTFHDGIRSKVFPLFASLQLFVLGLSTGGHWGALGNNSLPVYTTLCRDNGEFVVPPFGLDTI